MVYDALIVGGGIAGLTAAAYLARAGCSTLLCEKEPVVGGLVRTFWRNGFAYDGGIRAIENSGIVFPMLRQLGLDLDFQRSPVSLGVEERVIRLGGAESLSDYGALLTELFPESRGEIAAILDEMRRAMSYMDVLYGIDNPAFLDLRKDRDYLLRVIVPWLFRYAWMIRKIAALDKPVVEHLRRFTQNQSLLDLIAQHFFQETPAFFALSYFRLYLDYAYPLGGTGALPEALEGYIQEHGGEIRTGAEIVAVDAEQRCCTDALGRRHEYNQLLWAADLKMLYRLIDADRIADAGVRSRAMARRDELADKRGGDSILTLYLALDLDPSYFAERASPHFFYTPSRVGQSQAGPAPLSGERIEIERWIRRYLELTTYEISCPVQRDPTLAPPGQTGLVVSALMDYALVKRVEEQGWYDAFKTLCEECMLNALEGSVYPGLRAAVLDRFSSTPLSLAKYSGNTDGAITGWAFTNATIPAEKRMLQIAQAIRTPLPNIYQAGQWSYSPSGLPISILTGKMAADAVLKALKARKG